MGVHGQAAAHPDKTLLVNLSTCFESSIVRFFFLCSFCGNFHVIDCYLMTPRQFHGGCIYIFQFNYQKKKKKKTTIRSRETISLTRKQKLENTNK
jgi:hypothetical protein